MNFLRLKELRHPFNTAFHKFEKKYRVEIKELSYCREEPVQKEIPEGYIPILDKGYVGLTNCFGTELDIVNAARVSYNKQSEEFKDADKKLLNFLLRENHTSPLRHVSLSFECYAPLLVARQHWKYVVASTFVDYQDGWNESSRRYVSDAIEFYVPTEWRSAPENSKQGSGPRLDQNANEFFTARLLEYIAMGEQIYNLAVAQNVAPEQARLFLPAYGLYVRYRWTISLAGLINFLDQRLAPDAQHEITELAKAVYDLALPCFPNVLEYYKKENHENFA